MSEKKTLIDEFTDEEIQNWDGSDEMAIVPAPTPPKGEDMCPPSATPHRESARAGQASREAAPPMDVRSIYVECNGAVDILASLYAAWHKLPPCSLLGVIGGAIQEIQALRSAQHSGEPHTSDSAFPMSEAKEGNKTNPQGPYTELVGFLNEAARYFESRPTGGEDRAYWANVFNAEKCRKAATALDSLSQEVERLKANREVLVLGNPDLQDTIERLTKELEEANELLANIREALRSGPDEPLWDAAIGLRSALDRAKGLWKAAEQRCEELVKTLLRYDANSEFGKPHLREAADAIASLWQEVEGLKETLRRVHPNPADYRYWEGRYRDEAARAEAAEKRCEELEKALEPFALLASSRPVFYSDPEMGLPLRLTNGRMFIEVDAQHFTRARALTQSDRKEGNDGK